MRSRFASLLVAMLILGVYVTPVYAAKSDCGAGRFCAWSQINYGGEFASWPTSANDWPLFGMENDDDATYNREATRTNVYRGVNWTEGVAYCVVPGGFEDDILGDRDNNGDSNYLNETATTCSGFPTP